MTIATQHLISGRSAASRFNVKVIAFAVLGALSVLAAQNARSQVVANGGCDTYTPTTGQTVSCTPSGSNPDDEGVQTPEDNTDVNSVSVTVETGVVFNVNGSNIGLGSDATVVNRGTLFTRKARYGYGMSAGVNGRSTAGGNNFTNEISGVVLTEGADAHGMYVNARQSDAVSNSITNEGSVTTKGNRSDGIRLYTESTTAEDRIANIGSITTGGEGASGIHVQNTQAVTGTNLLIDNDGTITVNDKSGYGIYIEGAANVINSGTITADPTGYAIYVVDNGNTNANTVTLSGDQVDITGALKFSDTRTSEKLVFDGTGSEETPFTFNNDITGLNIIELSGANTHVIMGSANGYDLVDGEINVGSSAKLKVTGDITGTGGLTKTDTGAVTLSGVNTYSGGTELQGGTIVSASDTALGVGALEADGADVVLQAGKSNLTLANAVTLSTDLIIDTAGELVLLSGDVTGGGRLIKRGTGTLELAGENTFSGGMEVESGTLALDVNAASSTGEVIMAADTAVKADTTLSLDNVFKLGGPVEFNTQGFDLTLNNTLSNNSVGQLIKTGAGTLTLNGANDYSGGTMIEQGAIALYGTLASGVQVKSGTTLGGSGTITGDVTNAGAITPRMNGQRSTLTIVGNYVGQNGTFASVLGGTPEAIVADQLAIQGAGNVASGNTTINVTDPSGVLGKPTVGDGILLVGVTDGATSTSTSFTSPRIAAGAYEYRLVRGGESSAQSWYLKADIDEPQPPVVVTPEASQREEVALYPALPSLARQYLWSINGTLDDRRGAPDVIGQWDKQPVAWGRLIAQHNDTKPGNVNQGPGLKVNDWGLQLGADLWRSQSGWGQWRAGPVMTIGRSTGGAYNTTGSVQTGDISLNAYSLGLNATVASSQGAYADLLLLGTRLTGVKASSPLGTAIHTTGWAMSGSIEGGWRLPLNDKFSVTPQAQIYTTTVNLQDSSDAYSLVQMPTETTVLGRLGLKLSYDNIQAKGPRTQLWARASVYSTLSGKDASTSFLNVAGTNPTTFQSQAPGTWMALEAAVNVQATESTSVQLGLGYQGTFDNEYRGIYGQVNVRFGF